MSLPKTGTRKITVNDEVYRWVIRKKPTYCQGAFGSPMTFAVECVQKPLRTLLVTTTVARPDNWLGKQSIPITPAQVARAIQLARDAGWRPEVRGSAFTLAFDIDAPRPVPSPASRESLKSQAS